jgi:hypothetical protein
MGRKTRPLFVSKLHHLPKSRRGKEPAWGRRDRVRSSHSWWFGECGLVMSTGVQSRCAWHYECWCCAWTKEATGVVHDQGLQSP